MSIQSILATLNQLEKMHSSLLSLANEKTSLMKKGDMAAIDQLLKDEQAHLAAISQIENQRIQAVTDYLTKQGRYVSENPTISDVIEATQSENEKAKIAEAKDRLLHVIHDLKWQNDLNQKLTYQSLQFVNLSLDMVRPQETSVTYTESEVSGKREMKQSSTFDSQA